MNVFLPHFIANLTLSFYFGLTFLLSLCSQFSSFGMLITLKGGSSFILSRYPPFSLNTYITVSLFMYMTDYTIIHVSKYILISNAEYMFENT